MLISVLKDLENLFFDKVFCMTIKTGALGHLSVSYPS